MSRASGVPAHGPRRRAVAGVGIAVTPGGVLMAAVVAVAVLPGGASRAWSGDPGVLWVLVLAPLVLGGILVHELGHALVARRDGLTVDRVVVSFVGGTTELDGEIDRPRTEIAVALAGPVASLLAAGVLAGAARLAEVAGAPDWARSLALLAFWNLLVGLVNLVPLRPLDGGHVVAALARRSGGGRHRAG